MSEVSTHELYSLLVPLAHERLIVPRACVAEVVTWQAPETMHGAPPWYLGTIRWSGRPVPVVAFEAACGQAVPTPGTRTRIVIFVALSGALSSGYFGVMTQGFPQLVRLNADVVKADPSRSFGERGPILCQVQMLNESPLIPDFAWMEQMISEETCAA
ncbi:chemotaxis protein [Steroidobacter denitrificans]|uniref:Chemotaxis protein n=2 Tax=Steroidobacter denitrificans TaxID=465721 RepID=A0A127F5U3_STEDE|nr:chemotaxis protein [Steroidobacter denitrificans]